MAIPVMFSNCGTVSGATFSNGEIFVVNGFDCFVKNLSCCCDYNTCRVYEFLTSTPNGFLATKGGCGSKLYLLDKCFSEIGSICLPRDNGPLLTAYLLCGNKILLTYRKKIVVANCDGSISETVASSNCEETDFISAFPTGNGLLLAFDDGAQEIIQYRKCDGDISNCVLPNCTNIKSFTQAEDGTVYGLFAKGYPYRYLIPVVIDDNLNCVNEKCFGANLCI